MMGGSHQNSLHLQQLGKGHHGGDAFTSTSSHGGGSKCADGFLSTYGGGGIKCTDGFMSTFGCESGDSTMEQHHHPASSLPQQEQFGNYRHDLSSEIKEEEEPPFHTLNSTTTTTTTAPNTYWWSFSLVSANAVAQETKRDERKKIVRFSETLQAFSPACPLSAEEQQQYFWSNAEGHELKEERRKVLIDYKFNFVQAGQSLLWDDDTNESIRGLEDHTAELLGHENSYFVRRSHAACVLREQHAQKLITCCKDEERLCKVSQKSSRPSQARAIERAHADQRAATETSREPANDEAPTTAETSAGFALFVSNDSQEIYRLPSST